MMPILRCCARAALPLILLCAAPAAAQPTSWEPRGFSMDYTLTLPGAPDSAWSAITGDRRSWWDHSYSEKPLVLSVDAVPGGAFREVMDAAGNFALHARVITVNAPRLLRLEGPYGLAGRAVSMVVTWELEAAGADSTALNVQVNASGQLDGELAGVVDRVWRHFLFERLQPYMCGELEDGAEAEEAP